jgi:hypothetical protein
VAVGAWHLPDAEVAALGLTEHDARTDADEVAALGGGFVFVR